jgi:hypothetical protein
MGKVTGAYLTSRGRRTILGGCPEMDMGRAKGSLWMRKAILGNRDGCQR